MSICRGRVQVGDGGIRRTAVILAIGGQQIKIASYRPATTSRADNSRRLGNPWPLGNASSKTAKQPSSMRREGPCCSGSTRVFTRPVWCLNRDQSSGRGVQTISFSWRHNERHTIGDRKGETCQRGIRRESLALRTWTLSGVVSLARTFLKWRFAEGATYVYP